MLHDLNNLPNILDELKNLPYDFYLTGSRFFQSHPTESKDYDFLTEMNNDLIDELKVLGFIELDNYGQDENQDVDLEKMLDPDTGIVSVFRYTNPCIQVDVILVLDIRKHVFIRNVAKECGTISTAKGMNKKIWKFAHKLLKGE